MNKLEELKAKEAEAWLEVKRLREPYEEATLRWSTLNREFKKEELRQELLSEINNESDTKN